MPESEAVSTPAAPGIYQAVYDSPICGADIPEAVEDAPKLSSQPIQVMTGPVCLQLSGMLKQLQNASTREALSGRTRASCQSSKSSTYCISMCDIQISRCRDLVKTPPKRENQCDEKVAPNGQTL